MHGAMAAGNANVTRIRELVHLRRPNQSKQFVSLLGLLLLRAGHPAHPHLGRVPRRRAHRGAHIGIVRNDTSLALSSWLVVAWFLECIARKHRNSKFLTLSDSSGLFAQGRQRRRHDGLRNSAAQSTEWLCANWQSTHHGVRSRTSCAGVLRSTSETSSAGSRIRRRSARRGLMSRSGRANWRAAAAGARYP